MSTKIVATQENYLEVFDAMTAMDAFELASYIMSCYEEELVEFPRRLLSKPWKYSAIIIPALNYELEGKVREIENSLD